MIIKIDDTKFISYDETLGSAEVVDPSVLKLELETVNKRLEEIPPDPSDAVLLEWARLNYPRTDYSAEKNFLEQKKSKLEKIKQGIEAL
jgi:hypothetical protein